MSTDQEELISALEAQEEALVFTRFDNSDAWRLGSAMVAAAAERSLPVTIDIRRNGHQLFHAALPGTTAENDSWIERKVNVVDRFAASSYLVGRRLAAKQSALDEDMGVEPRLFAAHGGAFPIRVKDVGVVGAITVSGLPQADDHAFVVAMITAFLTTPSDPDGYLGDPSVRAQWDERYSEREQLWSGQPNGALVAEVADLTPGRVLDVGCGEGADAVWLARNGWDVTALEVSGVALARAATHAHDAGVTVHWVHAGLTDARLVPGSFDLVSAQYPALLRTPDAAAERALLGAVAPGGVLLVVHHAGMDTHPPHDAKFDPADYVWPTMIAAELDGDWTVEVDEQRPRVAPDGGAGAHHADDIVLRARRLR